jgi:hypothetical protein
MTNHGNNDNENNGTFVEAGGCTKEGTYLAESREPYLFALYLNCDRVWVGKCCCPEQYQNQTREIIITKVPVPAKFASTLMHPSIKNR